MDHAGAGSCATPVTAAMGWVPGSTQVREAAGGCASLNPAKPRPAPAKSMVAAASGAVRIRRKSVQSERRKWVNQVSLRRLLQGLVDL